MQAIKKLRENSQFFCFQLGHAPLGREGSGAFRRGRDRDRDLGGAFQYSRRGLRLRRRGAYGIHRASGPWCQGLCRKVASLRSGGRRLAVRITIEYQIGALPRTPFPAARDFAPVGSMSLDSRVAWLPYESSSFATSRGNERYEGKNSESYTSGTISAFSPFGGWRHHLARWESCHLIRGSQSSPMNPVSLSPPLRGGTIKLRGSIFS